MNKTGRTLPLIAQGGNNLVKLMYTLLQRQAEPQLACNGSRLRVMKETVTNSLLKWLFCMFRYNMPFILCLINLVYGDKSLGAALAGAFPIDPI